MPRKQKKYHFIYKTTNLLNEKFYVGMHSTDNLEDGYVGSGKRLRYSINKHGLKNHKFEILEFLPSREELKKREAEVVNEELLNDPLCMNLKFGGEGGWDHVNSNHEFLIGQAKLMTDAFIHKMKEQEFAETFSNTMSKVVNDPFTQRKIKEGRTANGKNYNQCKIGTTHTEETKSKIGMKNSKLQAGNNNSQFGTCWIKLGEDSKKVKKEDLQFWLDEGWQIGRKMKK